MTPRCQAEATCPTCGKQHVGKGTTPGWASYGLRQVLRRCRRAAIQREAAPHVAASKEKAAALGIRSGDNLWTKEPGENGQRESLYATTVGHKGPCDGCCKTIYLGEMRGNATYRPGVRFCLDCVLAKKPDNAEG